MKKPLILILLSVVLLNAACTIPLPSPRRMPAEREKRPIPDVMPKERGEIVDPKAKATSRVQLTTPPSQTGKPFKPGEKVDPAVIKARLQEAADEAAGATSLASSAQTQADWELVFAQWSKAIATLNEIPAAARTAAVKQAIATYQRDLARDRQTAQAKLNPKIVAPQAGRNDTGQGFIVGGDGAASGASPDPKASPNPQASPSPNASPNPAPIASPPAPPPPANP